MQASEKTKIQKGIHHLIKCADNAFPPSHPGLSKEDAELLLERMDCVSFLGGGTFGAVFETTSGGVVKFIPRRQSNGKLPCNATQEFKMHKRFARRGLTFPPHSLRHFQLNTQEGITEDESDDARSWVGLDAIFMPKVSSTLDKMLRDGAMLKTESQAVSLGASLAGILGDALSAGMVHHDAKCNNVGVSEDGSVRFIDFGRAFDERTLRNIGLSDKKTKKVLRIGAALDAWRLLNSVARCILRNFSDEACGMHLCDIVVGPLKAVSLQLLKEQKVITKDTTPEDAWWKNEEAFKDLKTKFSSCLEPHL